MTHLYSDRRELRELLSAQSQCSSISNKLNCSQATRCSLVPLLFSKQE